MAAPPRAPNLLRDIADLGRAIRSLTTRLARLEQRVTALEHPTTTAPAAKTTTT